ncbi:MAG: thiol-disulfide oxidoreductase DCC family protein [Bacteroidetes bacterium]|nr:thiol-disulfide oxidoreductase DCC family protein [Bacteroidota bacterium]MDA1267929.1 thiol-disulfide oxidoreductase DCC family protein [Bacteroidota bacterium]
MDKESILLFDGHCSLCNAAVDFVLKRDAKKKLLLASIQGPVGQRVLKMYQLPPSYLETLVLVEEGQVYLGSTAALRVARLLGGGWPLFYSLIIIPKGLRDRIYHWIGKHRYEWFGRRASCRMPTASEKSHFLNDDHPLLKSLG